MMCFSKYMYDEKEQLSKLEKTPLGPFKKNVKMIMDVK